MAENTQRPSTNPEHSSSPPEHYLPPVEAQPLAQPERAPEGQERRFERQMEQAPSGAAAALPTVQPQPSSPTPAAVSGDPVTATPTPSVANDVDVIEKAWVNKAKQIIKDNRDDPHAQEQAVEQLQIDYMKKRYGRDVKHSRA